MAEKLIDGVYHDQAKGMIKPVKLSFTVKDNKIRQAKVDTGSKGYFAQVGQKFAQEIVN